MNPSGNARAQNRWLLLVSIATFVVGVGALVYTTTIAAKRQLQSAAALQAAPELNSQQLIDQFHIFFYNSNRWKSTYWLGVPTLQNPLDMWKLQELVFDLKPDFIIETGTFHGGSSLYFAMLLDAIGGDGKVLTVDIEPHVAEMAKFPVFQKRVEVFTASSTDPDLVKQFATRVQGKKVLVTLDSDHSAQHVFTELSMYAPLVSVGSYIIAQDTNGNGHPLPTLSGPGPWEAVQSFLARNDQFVADREAEKFYISFYPGGFLKRVKPLP